MKIHFGHRALVAITAIAALSFTLATPSGATQYNFSMEMVEGSINVDTTMFETPGVGVEECSGGTGVSGTINTTTNTVTLNINISSFFTSPLDGEHYELIAHTTSSTHGTWTSPTEFHGVHLDLTFELWTIDTPSCETTHEVCTGTATLNDVEGHLYNGSTLPLSTGEQFSALANGSITSVPFGTCDFVWWLLLNGADLTLTENTTIGTSPGAIFEQV